MEGRSKRKSHWLSPLGLGLGWACPQEQGGEDLSLDLRFFLTGDSSDHLQEVQMPLIPFALCQLLYGQTSYILPDMICAGDLRNLKTVCEVLSTSGTGAKPMTFVFICLKA